MTDKVEELAGILRGDDQAKWVANLWDKWDNQRSGIKDLWREQNEFVFATDTSKTSVSSLPWKNSTVNPKLCQIRDNLHSNYIQSIFPNDRWLQWSAYDNKSASKLKAENIEGYMENKTRISNYRDVISKCLYDYIDYGNSFITTVYENKHVDDGEGGKTPAYVGPKAVRISPVDIVFNILADSFEETPKIVRSHKSVGEIKKMITYTPGQDDWERVISRRENLNNVMSSYSTADWDKASQIAFDGFGNYQTYLGENSIEILEFYGDFHDPDTGVLKINQMITIADRAVLVRMIDTPTIDGKPLIRHVGWRKRNDNLWHMGPLENLVGMQYRIDHLENSRADAIDLIIHPPLKIIGNVEEFVWGPEEEIHIDEGGDVQEVSKSFNGVIAAKSDITDYEDRMELYAGAPREAMGVRTPGEKTAFEVQRLENAAGRIFQEKTTAFEINLMEPNLNDQLEMAVTNLDGNDTIRVLDNDLKAQEFRQITKNDIRGNGIIRPIGARHFAQQAQELQNLIGVFNSPIASLIAPHTSGINMSEFVNDVVNLKAYNIFRPNVAINEAKDTQHLAAQAEEDNIVAQTTDPEEGVDV